MNKGFTAIEMVICLAIFVLLVAISLPSAKDAQKLQHERSYPCINGVRYIRSDNGQGGLTPMIDPKTMQPQLCGPEADRP